MDTRLLERKRELYDALHTLDRDLVEGQIDAEAYGHLRTRYEDEAADVLEAIDKQTSGIDEHSLRASRPRPGTMKVMGIGALIAAAAIFLASALHAGSATAITPTAVPTSGTSTAITRALATVAQHPRQLSSLLALGGAYMDARDATDADKTYRSAIPLAPSDPEPRVLDSVALSALGKTSEAEATLHSVEVSHPAFARAWLLDGLLSSRNAKTLPRAIAAWKHFLKLQPRGRVAVTVRQLLARAEGKR
jgi:cytochrome c-type biogenesis protein CcmH/NrfG